jgi:hypothetical protein
LKNHWQKSFCNEINQREEKAAEEKKLSINKKFSDAMCISIWSERHTTQAIYCNRGGSDYNGNVFLFQTSGV